MVSPSDLGTNDGTIRKAGSFYSYGDVRLGQGREAAKEYLTTHGDLALEVEQRIRASAGRPSVGAVEEPVAPADTEAEDD